MSEPAEKIERPEYRHAEHEDVDYFIEAGREFCKRTPYSFDEDSYAAMFHELVKQQFDDPPGAIIVVRGYPAKAHCAASLVPSIFNQSETIARIFSTWGDGGLMCFKVLEMIIESWNANYLVADAFLEPRIMRFYERQGMHQTDTVFFKEL